MSDMGSFPTTIQLENSIARGRLAIAPEALVDTTSEMTWRQKPSRGLGISVKGTKRFVTATGERVEPELGYAIMHAAEARTIDEVVLPARAT